MNAIGGTMLHLVLPSVASVAAGFAVKYLAKLAAKAHVDLTQQQQDALKQDVKDAILAVEEKATTAKSSSPAVKPYTSTDKLDTATAMVLEKHPEATHTAVQDLIHAQLPIVRQQFGSFSTMAR
jgi:hypothetical protein